MRIELGSWDYGYRETAEPSASYRARAKATENEPVRNYENDMACYLESVIAWIEARRVDEASQTISVSPKPAGTKKACS